MAFHRHFIERSDFEVQVVTNCESWPNLPLAYQPVRFSPSWVTQRLFRTRLMPWLYGLHSLTAVGRIPRHVWRAAMGFNPDAIFTIAGSWDWSALVAQQVARKLQVPLIGSFNDWFNYGWFPSHRIYHGMLEWRFRRFYQECDLVLCTCEGMREALGAHRNAHVLYPMGSHAEGRAQPSTPIGQPKQRTIVGFAGSMADWYGPMLEHLVGAVKSKNAPVEFRFYGSNPTWTREFDGYARLTSIYRGHLPFADLKEAMGEVDILLLPMGFEARAAQVERTSFKTKFLDYLAYQKPIVVWGPEYCSAVRVAREFDSAELCTHAAGERVTEVLLRLAQDSCRQQQLVANARRMYADRFHPDKIHAGLVAAITQTVRQHGGPMPVESRLAAA